MPGSAGPVIGATIGAFVFLGVAMLYARRRTRRADSRLMSQAGTVDPATDLADLPVLVVDLETTGLDVRSDRVVSIGAIPGHGARLDPDRSLDVLVNPARPIPKLSTSIHGITDAMVADAPTFAEAFGTFDSMLRNRVMIGHNAGFDVSILRRDCERAGLAWPYPPVLDIVRLAAALEPRERDVTLEAMAGRWGIAVSGRHTALGDASMAGAMWRYLLPRLAEAGVTTLGDALTFERRARWVIAHQKRAGWD